MPQKEILNRSEQLDSFLCLNCDQTITLIEHVKLFCSEVCVQEAQLVRYVRRCTRDGRINQPDVKEAIEIRLAFVMNSGYPRQERSLSSSKRQAVITRDGGHCRTCGAAGTDIDHINGNSDEMDNLQLLCRSCHNKKTLASIIKIGPEHELYEELKRKKGKFQTRVNALVPMRLCDDEEKWETTYRKIMSERRKVLKK